MFTVNNVLEATKQTEVFNIVNAIRNSASPYFQSMVPLANATNVVEVGQAITSNPQLQNEFASSLINRIGLVLIHHASLRNPLSIFKSGTMQLGDTIEEIFTDLTKEHLYDADVAETELFKREIPNVHTLYHKLNRKGFYKQTIQEQSLQSAFTSWEKFGSFTASIIQALHNSASVDEYKYMKLLLTNYYAKGHFTVVNVPSNVSDTALIQKAREIAVSMTLPQGSREFNSLAVHTVTQPEDLFIFMTPQRAASIDVNVLASAFNMDKTTFIGNRVILDDLGSNPDTDEKIELIIIDRRFFMVKDNTVTMRSEYNAQGLYWNYWLHIWQILSASRFANAVAIVSGDIAPIQEVVINPEIFELKEGKSRELTAFVKTPFGETYSDELAWTALDGDTLQAITVPVGFTITTLDDQKRTARVTITDAATAPENIILVVTASYTVGEGEEEETKTVSGRSYLHVNKN